MGSHIFNHSCQQGIAKRLEEFLGPNQWVRVHPEPESTFPFHDIRIDDRTIPAVPFLPLQWLLRHTPKHDATNHHIEAHIRDFFGRTSYLQADVCFDYAPLGMALIEELVGLSDEGYGLVINPLPQLSPRQLAAYQEASIDARHKFPHIISQRMFSPESPSPLLVNYDAVASFRPV